MKEFSFTLSQEEVIDYYTYLLSSSKSNRMKQLFFVFSVPLLLLLTYLYFKLNNQIISIIFIIVSIVWIMIIAPRFWKSYTRVNIGKNFLKNNKITKFEEVKIQVNDDYLLVNGKKYNINKDVKIVKTSLVSIFFFPNQPVVIPNRFLK